MGRTAFGEVSDNSHADKILRYGLAGDELKEIDSKVSYITLDEIPDKVKETFVAYEDVRFYKHRGYDLRGIIRSLVNNMRGRSVQGASTITMQLAKMLFLYQEEFNDSIKDVPVVYCKKKDSTDPSVNYIRYRSADIPLICSDRVTYHRDLLYKVFLVGQ